MDPILIIDELCPFPYDSYLLNQRVLGGTEATILRITDKLSEKIPIVITQHNRPFITRTKNVTYTSFMPQYFDTSWQAVIYLRKAELALASKALFKKAQKFFIWLHDLIDINLFFCLEKLAKENIQIIVVSDFHKKQVFDLAKIDPYFKDLPKVHRIYNPIADELNPEQNSVNKNKLIFASSPHKGLRETFEMFTEIRKRYPNFELSIANPGYVKLKYFESPRPGVINLGELKHSENIKQLREALCVFYPNHVYPETFGLIFAEANAIGTPVLAHPFGAASEVLTHPEQQLVNTYDLEAVITRLMQWYEGNRPVVGPNEAFRLSQVSKEWENLLLKDYTQET